MNVKAKIINYYRDEEQICSNGFDCANCSCDIDECFLIDKEIVYIDKEYKKCEFYKNGYGIYFLKLGNKTYTYDQQVDDWGGFVDTRFEYILVNNELIFGNIGSD